MRVRHTPARLVLHHRPRFAAAVAVTLWGAGITGGLAVSWIWPGGPLLSGVIWVVLLALAGLAVLLTEPRAKAWIFDRRVQEVRVLRFGWIGAFVPEVVISLAEIQEVSGDEGRGRDVRPTLRLRDGRRLRLFDEDVHRARDRRRALQAVRAFLEAERGSAAGASHPQGHYFGPTAAGR